MRKRFAFIAMLAALAAAGWLALWLRGGMEAPEAVRRLSALRLSAELYRQEHKRLPAAFADTVRAGTLEAAPYLKLPGHFRRGEVKDVPAFRISDSGGWAYVNDPKSPDFGLVYMDCSHRDERGRYWSEF